MITLLPTSGRTGNQLFALAFCRILAKRLGVGLKFKLSDNIPQDWFPNVFDEWPGDSTFVALDEIEISDSAKSMDEIVAECQNKDVRVHGYFERAEYYLPHTEMLRTMFWQDLTTVPKHDFVFHFRGTDFQTDGQGKEVPVSYYLRAWQTLGEPKAEDVIICTDDPDYPVLREFCDKIGIGKVAMLSPQDDFKTMRNARNLVISRSTFAWWAAFLSDAAVIQPATSGNLIVPHWAQL